MYTEATGGHQRELKKKIERKANIQLRTSRHKTDKVNDVNSAQNLHLIGIFGGFYPKLTEFLLLNHTQNQGMPC